MPFVAKRKNVCFLHFIFVFNSFICHLFFTEILHIGARAQQRVKVKEKRKKEKKKKILHIGARAQQRVRVKEKKKKEKRKKEKPREPRC